MILCKQNWGAIENNFFDSSPFNYTILDNFIMPEDCEIIRQKLLNSYKWRIKNWVSLHLHNNEPIIEEVDAIKRELIQNCQNIMEGVAPLTHWGLMYHKNTKGNVHADNCARTITIWLTPDKYNLDRDSGGLILYDVKKPEVALPHEHLVGESSMKTVNELTQGRIVIVPYRYNRAVLFDGKTFHCTQQPNFDINTPDGYRINLSIAFDDIEEHNKKLQPYLDEYQTIINANPNL